MLSHTATTANPEIADSTTNTVSGATTLENSASTPPSILTDSAVSGTPFFVTRAKQAGSVRSFDSDHSMRPEAYSPEFAADRIAVRITKLKISAAYGIPTFSNTSTNGLFSTPACCIGISAASTNTVPIKKIISRAIVVRIATGMTLRGFSVSPAAIPISSVPEKAKFTATIVIRIGKPPCGNQPSAVILLSPGAGAPSCIGIKPKIAAPPRMIKAMIVTTFTSENQNSPSAKKRVEMTFRPKIIAQNTTHQTQTGTCGNQYCIQNPAAVKLEPSATVQVSQ